MIKFIGHCLLRLGRGLLREVFCFPLPGDLRAAKREAERRRKQHARWLRLDQTLGADRLTSPELTRFDLAWWRFAIQIEDGFYEELASTRRSVDEEWEQLPSELWYCFATIKKIRRLMRRIREATNKVARASPNDPVAGARPATHSDPVEMRVHVPAVTRSVSAQPMCPALPGARRQVFLGDEGFMILKLLYEASRPGPVSLKLPPALERLVAEFHVSDFEGVAIRVFNYNNNFRRCNDLRLDKRARSLHERKNDLFLQLSSIVPGGGI